MITKKHQQATCDAAGVSNEEIAFRGLQEAYLFAQWDLLIDALELEPETKQVALKLCAERDRVAGSIRRRHVERAAAVQHERLRTRLRDVVSQLRPSLDPSVTSAAKIQAIHKAAQDICRSLPPWLFGKRGPGRNQEREQYFVTRGGIIGTLVEWLCEERFQEVLCGADVKESGPTKAANIIYRKLTGVSASHSLKLSSAKS